MRIYAASLCSRLASDSTIERPCATKRGCEPVAPNVNFLNRLPQGLPPGIASGSSSLYLFVENWIEKRHATERIAQRNLSRIINIAWECCSNC